MITFVDIETALGQRLETIADGVPVAWPNNDFVPTGEYFEFRNVPASREDQVISGGYPYQYGIALITAVAPKGSFSNRVNELAQIIADGFPKALRLAAGSGTVLITAPASPAPAFPDGAYFRLPVRVAYLTEGV